MTNEERMRKLTDESRDNFRFAKFVRYCEVEGLGSVDAEEDRYFSEQQKRFFEPFEREMEPLLYALEGIVGTE